MSRRLFFAVSALALTATACVQGDSSKDITFDVPADGAVTVLITSTATPNTEERSDSFRLDFGIYPGDYVDEEGGLTISLEGALTGDETRIWNEDTPEYENGMLIANDVMSECAVGQECVVETLATFTSVAGATAEINTWATLSVDGGDMDVADVSIEEQ